MRTIRRFDALIFFSTVFLVIGGFLIFLSASLGLLARDGAQFSDIAVSQFFLGVVGGFIMLYITSHIPYRLYRSYALYIFLFACALCVLVFFPPFGLSLNGAHSWLDFGFTTFQPAEFLKIAYVLYLAAWLSGRPAVGKKYRPFIERTAPFVLITGLVAVLLLLQPDTGTFMVVALAGGAMYFASGAKLKDMLILGVIGLVLVLGLVATRPYALERLQTYLNPARDPLGAGYQVQKSLIAVGSGELFGRGYGQSIQKFTTLPEPTADSIFGVFAEEFGFVGSMLLILAFLTFGLRALFVSARTSDLYGGLVIVGVAILIVVQSFFNMGSMVGVFPLSGLPLIFVSHGGSALFMALTSVGIVLNISRTARH